MRLSAIFGVVIGFCVSLTSVSAQEGVYQDLAGSEVVALLDAHGYNATLTADDFGDPLIMGSADGLKFQVQTYNCNDAAPRRCKTLRFLSSFAAPSSISADEVMKAMNDFNKSKVYGRAFVNDDNDPTVDFRIDLSGGVTAANLMDQVGTWKSFVLDVFIEHLGWDQIS